MVTLFPSQVTSLLFFSIMIKLKKIKFVQDKPKHRTAMLLIQKASSDGSLLNTFKLNLTSRHFYCDNFKKLEQLHKKHYQSKICTS